MTKSNKRYLYSNITTKPDILVDHYYFVFSSNIQDWQVGYNLNWNRKHKKNGAV